MTETRQPSGLRFRLDRPIRDSVTRPIFHLRLYLVWAMASACSLATAQAENPTPAPSYKPSSGQSSPPRIDLEKLQASDRFLANRILKEATIVQPLEERVVEASVPTYRFLLERLDLAGLLVEAWKLGRYKILRQGPGHFLIDDRQGAIAKIREIGFVKTERTFRHLYLADGYFRIPIVPGARVHGTGLIALEYEPVGPGKIRTRAWLYFRIDNKFLSQLSRLIRKIVGRVVAKKCRLFVQAAACISERIQKEPAKTYEFMKPLRQVPKNYLPEYRRAFGLED